jgi:hypothetical protein
VTNLCERLKWRDKDVWSMPYLRVGMHIRNLEIIGKMERDSQKESEAKAKLEQRQNSRLKGMGVK